MSKNYPVEYDGDRESLQIICNSCEKPICIIVNYKAEVHDIEVYCEKCLPIFRRRYRNLMGAMNPNVN